VKPVVIAPEADIAEAHRSERRHQPADRVNVPVNRQALHQAALPADFLTAPTLEQGRNRSEQQAATAKQPGSTAAPFSSDPAVPHVTPQIHQQ